MSHRAVEDWTGRFSGLARLSEDVKATLLRESRVATVPQGSVIFGPGKAPENLLLLLEGTVRVQQTGESGRDILLYRVGAGESCVLTTACLLAYEDYSAEGIAETELTAVLVPRRTFDDLIARSPEFRRFVFTAYSRRITDLFLVIEEIVFRRLDAPGPEVAPACRPGRQPAGDAPEPRAGTRHRPRGGFASASGIPAARMGGTRARRRQDHRPGRAAAPRRGAGVT
jgi:hypothetical protein